MTTPNDNKFAALQTMIDKLDNRGPDSSGYVTYLPEVKEILNQLSTHVPASITLGNPIDLQGQDDYLAITIKIGFTLSRSELAEAEEKAAKAKEVASE